MFTTINRKSATTLAVVCLMGVGFILEPGRHDPAQQEAEAAPQLALAELTVASGVNVNGGATPVADDAAPGHIDGPALAPVQVQVQPDRQPAPSAALSAHIAEGYRGSSAPLPQNPAAQARRELGEDLSAILP